MAAGHRVVGAEPVVVRWIAAPGDPGRGQLLDIGLEDGTVVVGEFDGTLIGEAERSNQERRHLAAAHRVGGAVSIVLGRVAAAGYSHGRNRFYCCLMNVAIVVEERATGLKRC